MKHTLLTLFLIFSVNFSFAQIAFAGKEFQNTIITNCENKTAEEMYQKTLNWISYTFTSPDDVLMAKIENDYIRIRGSKKQLACYNTIGKICNDVKFTIEISFKDGRYKFEIIELQENVPYFNQYAPGGWQTFNLSNFDHFYNKKGVLKTKFKYFVEEVPLYFNNLNKELQQFIQNENIPSKREDW